MSGGDFLSRWSRRKLEGRQGEPREAVPSSPAAGEPEMTPEEIAALPKPEELTPETDIAPFFRKGVPEVLRNAVLRRMWSLDPAIRDFEGPARDYAWDWNVPGGVPGNGPLLPSDDVESMLRQVFGDSPEPSAGAEAARAEGPAEVQPPLGSPAEPDVGTAAAHGHDPGEADADRPAALGQAAPGEGAVALPPVAAPQSIVPPSPPAGRRRHGGAKPV